MNAASSPWVLVVEDDETVRDKLRTLLEHEGYDVSTADDTDEAVKLLTARRGRCLVLLDPILTRAGKSDLFESLGRDDVLVTIPVVVVSTTGPTPPGGKTRFTKDLVEPDVLLEIVREVFHGAGTPRLLAA